MSDPSPPPGPKGEKWATQVSMRNLSYYKNDEGEDFEGTKLKGGCNCICAVCKGPTCFLSFVFQFVLIGLMCAIAATAVQAWYWTGIVEHSSTATASGQTYDYKFYSLVTYGIFQFCHYPQSLPEINDNLNIAYPSYSDWQCENWENVDATVTQGSRKYTITDCSSDNCKDCREAMETGYAWAILAIVGLVPVGVLLILSMCFHGCLYQKCEKILVVISILCLAGSIAAVTAGLIQAADRCSDFNQELASAQNSIFHSTTNGADNSDHSMILGPSAYLGIGAIGAGAAALVMYALYFFCMSGAAWVLFVVLWNGGVSVGFAIAALSFNAWYWSQIREHSNTAQYLGQDVDYTFYSMIAYGITQFCYYPTKIPSLSIWNGISYPGYNDLRCLNWENLNAEIEIGSSMYTLLACVGEPNTNATTVTTQACHDCQTAMRAGEGLGITALLLTVPVAAMALFLILGESICKKTPAMARMEKILSYISIGCITAAIAMWTAALTNAAGKCDNLNSELEKTTGNLWSIATSGSTTNGDEMVYGPSAYCATLSLVFGFLALLAFIYFTCFEINAQVEADESEHNPDNKTTKDDVQLGQIGAANTDE